MPKPKKLIGLELEEISLVDRPANVGAKVALFKREVQDMNEEIKEMFKNFMESLQRLIKPEEKTNKGDTSNMDEKEKLQKQIDELTKKLADAETAKSQAEALSKMSDAERAYMQNLPEKERQGFMGMSVEERKARMTGDKKKIDENPDFKKAIEENEKLNKRVAELEEKDALAKFTKQAEKDYPHIVGKSEEKGAVLKAIDAMPEDVKKILHTILKSAEEAMKKQLTEIGSSAEDTSTPEAKLKALALKRAEETKKSYTEAYDAVIQTSEGKALYDEAEKSKAKK